MASKGKRTKGHMINATIRVYPRRRELYSHIITVQLQLKAVLIDES